MALNSQFKASFLNIEKNMKNEFLKSRAFFILHPGMAVAFKQAIHEELSMHIL